MRLTEFSLLIIATVVGVVAGLALASKYNAARGLFWTSALLFCSLGVVWSATAEDNSPTERIIVPLVIGGIALAAVWWQKRRMRSLWDIMIACGTRACIQLRRIVTAANCAPARKFLASLS